MYSPTPFSLKCALLICLPIAVVYYISSSTSNAPVAAVDSFSELQLEGANSTDGIGEGSSGNGESSSPDEVEDLVKNRAPPPRLSLIAPLPLLSPSPPKKITPLLLSPPPPRLLSPPPSMSSQQAPLLSPPPPLPQSPPLLTPSPPPPILPQPPPQIFSEPPLSQSLLAPSPLSPQESPPLNPPWHPPPQPPIQVEFKEDYEKLALAGLVDARAKRPLKVAFMFLITDALPFAPLWEAFFLHAPAKLYNVYIHADPSVNNSTAFSGVFANRLIESKPTRRYSPTLISAARRLLAHALIHDESNSHFALISASCIPLHSFKFTCKTLVSSRKSFIEILPNETDAYGRWMARGDDAMLPDVPFEVSRIGSQFWVLTRRHARTVVRDKRIWSKFKQECTRWWECYPEESYFPTVLSVRDEMGCVPATLTHVDWNGSIDGHPRTYSSEDVNAELILRLRSDRPRYGDEEKEEMRGNGLNSSDVKRWHPFLFARKFEAAALGALMKIAGVILKD